MEVEALRRTGRNGYGSNVLAYLQVARRTGAEVVVVPDDEHGQIDTAALAQQEIVNEIRYRR